MIFFRTYLLLGIISFSSLSGWTQDPVREIININKSFYKEHDIAMEVTTTYFMDNALKPTKESKTTIYKVPGSYLYKTSGFESMANSNYKINVNHQKKEIIVASVTNSAKKNKKSEVAGFEKQDFKLSLDTALSFYKKVEVKSKDDLNNEIIFSFKSGLYDYIKIIYDKKSFRVYSYAIKLNATANNSKDGKKHDYSYLITNKYLNEKVLSKKTFSENNYIEIKKQEIIPSQLLNGYKVVNNTKDNNTKN